MPPCYFVTIKWRKAWEDDLNAALEREGVAARVDHRSYERQGIEKVPTVHLGVAASQMEKRGIRTELGDKNRAAAVTNQQLGQLRACINKLKNWVYAQPLQDAPTMRDLMNGIFDGQNLKSHWKRIANLQTAAKAFMFLQDNNITDMEQLADKVTRIHQQRYDLAGKITAAERRITKLNEYLAQVDIWKQHKAVYKKYQQLDPKKRGAYTEKHAEEISQYESALRYLKNHLNGRDKIPEKEWRAERYAHVDDYYKLKEDIRNVEVLRRTAEKLIDEVAPERTPTRGRDMTLQVCLSETL